MLYSPLKRSPAEEFFAAGGPLSKCLPGYSPREGQIGAARMVEKGLGNRVDVIIEAGTGTGKSLVALIPTLLQIRREGGSAKGRRVVVSTAMLNLQDQYTKKDIPIAIKALSMDTLDQDGEMTISGMARKGRTNYLCPAKRDNLHQYMTDNDVDLPMWQQPFVASIMNWDDETGELSELPFDITQQRQLHRAVTADSNTCKGNQCPFFDDGCPYYDSKRRANECEVIVVNHALLIMDAKLGGQVLLPPYDYLVVDEAHKLPDVVRSQLESKINPFSFLSLVERADKLGVVSKGRADTWKDEAEEALERLSGSVSDIAPAEGTHRFKAADIGQETREACDKLLDIANQVYILCGSELSLTDPADESAPKMRQLSRDAESMVRGLTGLAGDGSGANSVMWIDHKVSSEGESTKTIHVAPIHVGTWFKANFDQKVKVLMSATLATGTGLEAFDHFKDQLGLAHTLNYQIPSPFDYINRQRYTLGSYKTAGGQILEKPPANNDEWIRLLCPRVKWACELTEGGTLILFTSLREMEAVHSYLERELPRGQVPWNLLKQGGKESKQRLIELFKRSDHSILCASSSFFEGVDLPGHVLRSVQIAKIPFPNPSEPIQAALSDSYGRNGFHRHSIPHALVHLKQAVGRLLRTVEDRGVIFLWDPRWKAQMEKRGRGSYAPSMLAKLPGFTHAATAEELKTFLRDILDELPRRYKAPVSGAVMDRLLPLPVISEGVGEGNRCESFAGDKMASEFRLPRPEALVGSLPDSGDDPGLALESTEPPF